MAASEGDANGATTSSHSTRFLKGSSVPKPPNNDGKGLWGILMHPTSILLVCLPFGCAAHFCDWGKIAVFWLNFFGMVPLAKILGDATEELAAGLKNDMLAGLLNATFGNIVELVITVQTLRSELFDVVKATLLGSVLSNMLLVLGMSFFCGGIFRFTGDRDSIAQAKAKTESADDIVACNTSASIGRAKSSGEGFGSGFVAEKVQKFQVLGALVNISMLLLSCLSFMIVTIFRTVTSGVNLVDDAMLPVSRTSAIVVISCYAAYIIFQLGTHRHAMAEDEEEAEDEDSEPLLSLRMSTVLLCVTTLLVAFSSQMLVDAIHGVTEDAHLGEHFIGIVLLPIIGNACEHAAAVRFAMRDKLGLSIGIAVGSSTQIALFAVPFSVLAGWAMNRDMDLNFGALNVSVMTISVIVVLSMVVDGQSNWLQGYLLMAAYVVIAVCYWHLPNNLPEFDTKA